MKLKSFQKAYTGGHLKQYELTYENRDGKSKIYEIVSRSDYSDVSEIATKVDGVSIVGLQKDSKTNEFRLLLLKEFRLGINKAIYNLCAGLKNTNETIEQCVSRELYEETGLKIKKIVDVLEPSFSAVAISDILTSIVFIEIDSNDKIEDHTSANEEISANFYTKDEVYELLKTHQFSSRAQGMAYFFTKGLLEQLY